MKNKKVKFVATLLSAVLLAAVPFGCSPKKEVDEEGKTYLYVQVYDGGYGYGWVEEAGRRFSETHSDVVIRVSPKTEEGYNVYQNFSLETNDLYFVDGTRNYYDFVDSDYLVDITDIATGAVEGQNHSIVDTLNEDLRNYYGVKKDDGTHYYALPWGLGYGGMAYDAELFFNKGLYLTREYDQSGNEGAVDNFVISHNENKNANGEYASLVTENGQNYYKTVKGEYLSMGPDGTYGTYDDGMPSTYKEFFALCRYMNDQENVKPFVYAQKFISFYMKLLWRALEADYAGYDQTLLNYTFDGVLKNVMSVNDAGVITDLPDVTLTPGENSSQNTAVFQTKSKYYAFDFIKKIFTDDGEWLGNDCRDGAASHLDAQESFLLTKRDPQGGGAFLIDGIWWEYEARDTYADLAKQYGDAYKQENRMIRQVPLPKANKDIVKQKRSPMSIDHVYQAAFILKKDDSSKVELAKEFLKFMMTDESHKAFTVQTGIRRPYAYDLSSEQYNSLSSYQKSLWDMTAGEKTVAYPVSEAPYFRYRFDYITPIGYASFVDGFEYNNMVEQLYQKNQSVKQVFDGLYANVKRMGL